MAQAKRPKFEPPVEFQEGDIATMDTAGLIRILSDSGSSEFQKAKACQRLGEHGDKEAVTALAALLHDEHMSVYARYGLEPIAGPSAGEALRDALSALEGERLIGVINSLGKRRDERARPALAKMLNGSDTDVARAAAAALGSIGGTASAKELKAALPKTSGLMKMAVADACLVCAERLLEAGQRDEALALYTHLSAPAVPKAARLAAMTGIIREERSLSRPR